jgi:hypothetical protein
MMMLFHEHDEDPKMRPEPISPKKHEEVIAHMAAGLLGAYRYFPGEPTGQSQRPNERSTAQCSQGQVERPVPVRLGEEVQAVLRRGDGELRFSR